MNVVCYERVCYERGLLWTGLFWTDTKSVNSETLHQGFMEVCGPLAISGGPRRELLL